jgi:hypothetical protein
VTTADVLLALAAGLAVNECCDLSPWAARKLVRWSAHLRYTNNTRAQLRADELAALIDHRPGKLLKLFTAFGFIASALAVRAWQAASSRLARLGAALQRLGQRLGSKYSPTGQVASSTTASADLRERDELARRIAATLRSLDASKATIVNVRGPWGSGKTFLMDLVVDELRTSSGPVVVKLNPWHLWNEPQPSALFTYLASQVPLESPQLANVADSMRLYGDSLARRTGRATAPTSLDPPEGATDRLLPHRNRGSWRGSPQASLKRALRQLPQPLIVVVDDTDRLLPDDARSVFQLVRLTARLPQLVYMMAFDRALAEPLYADEARVGSAPMKQQIQEISYDLPHTVRRRPV